MYFSKLDAYRFIAVVLVLLSHWITPITHLFPIGTAGVFMFFVLSGFLISNILIGQAVNPRLHKKKWKALSFFYARRFLRIFPIYYLVIFSFLFIFKYPFVKEYSNYFLFYGVNFLVFKTGWISPICHTWSLAIEEQFYLFWPFAILFFSTKRGILFIIITSFIICSIFSVLTFQQHILEFFVLPTPVSMISLISGAALAWLYKFRADILQKISTRNNLLLSLAILLLIRLFQNTLLFNLLFLAAITWFSVSFISYLISPSHNSCNWFWKNRQILYLGKISYGIYLYHKFVPFLLTYFFGFNYNLPGGNKYTSHIIYYIFYPVLFFAITLILSIISWEIFEKKINNLKAFFVIK